MEVEALTEAAVADVQIPEVNPEVIRGDERLLVGIDRDRVDVIRMCIRVYFPRYSSNDVVLQVRARKSQVLL